MLFEDEFTNPSSNELPKFESSLATERNWSQMRVRSLPLMTVGSLYTNHALAKVSHRQPKLRI